MSAWWVTGRRSVQEAIRSGRARELLVGGWVRTTPGLRGVLEAAQAAELPVREAPRSTLDGIGPDHQGVAVRVDPPRELTDRQLAELRFGPDDLVVVLDGITDPHNFGAAARTAEAAGAVLLVTRSRRAAGLTPAALRASAGALAHLPVARVTNIRRAIDLLANQGFTVVGLDEDALRSILDGSSPAGPVALVVGSEGRGLSRLVREGCHVLVALPMRGRVESLNASAALAAALYGFVLPSRGR